jgi:DNA ligase 1
MRSLNDVYERVGSIPFTAEFKYDGQRVQIHAEKSDVGKHSVSLFSRHLEDMTDKVFPHTPEFIALADVVAVP